MGLDHHLPLHTSVQMVAILKKKAKRKMTFLSVL